MDACRTKTRRKVLSGGIERCSLGRGLSALALATPASSTREERTWALVAHLGGPAGILLSAGLFGFAVPLVIYLAKRDDGEFAGDQAKEALNFQLTLFLLHAAIWIFVLATLGIGLLVVWPFAIALWLGEVVLGIVAALKSYGGTRFRYPLTLRLIG